MCQHEEMVTYPDPEKERWLRCRICGWIGQPKVSGTHVAIPTSCPFCEYPRAIDLYEGTWEQRNKASEDAVERMQTYVQIRIKKLITRLEEKGIRLSDEDGD